MENYNPRAVFILALLLITTSVLPLSKMVGVGVEAMAPGQGLAVIARKLQDIECIYKPTCVYEGGEQCTPPCSSCILQGGGAYGLCIPDGP